MTLPLKFYADEHVPRSVVNGLRLRGIDVITAQDANLLAATDLEHLKFAQQQSRVIITQDQDFLRFHARGIDHSGLVYAHQQTDIGPFVRQITLIFQLMTPQDMKNHVEFIS